jgi:putative ABC transport system permease protein
MLRNYLTTAIRNLWRHRATTAINLVGLAVSLAVCFLVVLFLHQQWTLDRFHPNADRIYRMATDYGAGWSARAPLPLASALREQAAGVAAVTRLARGDHFVTREEASFSVQALYADASFFDVFQGFRLQAGSRAQALQEPHTAVLTADAARRLFGDGPHPLGKTFALGGEETFTVTGVLAPTPGPTHIGGDVFLSHATIAPASEGPDDWDNFTRWTYLRLAAETAPGAVTQLAHELLQRNAPEHEAATYRFQLESLSAVRFGGMRIQPMSARTQIPVYVYYFFLAIAGIVLLAAGFNYVNLTTAQSLQRAKEIGVRKTLGANRAQLGMQFLGESVLTCLIAAVGACLLLYPLVPLFNTLYFFQLLALPPLAVSLLGEPGLLLLFGGVAVGFGLVAGSYPAFVLSSSRPVGVLTPGAGVSSPFGRLSVRTLLVGGQFAFALLLIVTAMTLYRQSDAMAEANHALRTENVVTVALQDVEYERFRRAARRLPEVEGVTVVDILPLDDDWYQTRLRSREGEAAVSIFRYHSDTSFVRTMDVRIVAAQADWAVPYMARDGVLLNASAVQALGWTDPAEALGATVFTRTTEAGEPVDPARVVGVLENFEFRGSYYIYGGTGGGRIPPLVLRYHPSYTGHALVRSATDDVAATRDRLEALWSTALQTAHPFEARFYSDVIRARHGPLQDLATVVGFIGGLAVLITLLGLLSMAAHYVQIRTQEVGIRKAMGATASSLVVLLSRHFLVLIGVAVGATLPLAWVLNQQWLQYLPDPVSVGSGGLAGALGALLLLALLTIGSQTFRAARLDPARVLRSE